MRRLVAAGAGMLALGIVALACRPALSAGLDPGFGGALLGSRHAKGVVVWNHGRSLADDDARSPTPLYLRALREAGWDVLRFDRPRAGDTLDHSAQQLVGIVAQLKKQGYRRITLAGQSYGAFLALMAADQSDAVDAVIATAPAAYGDFEEFYGTWRLNATRLYPLIERVKRARVMLFFFHGDDFDPGGRGEASRAILARREIGFAIVDQPAYLVGHWISASGAFLRRFGDCVRDFADADALRGEFRCRPAWGDAPSAAMRLPEALRHAETAAPEPPAALGASTPVSAAATLPGGPSPHDVWYGFYPNGREVLLAIETVRGPDLSAVYAIGPGIDKGEPAQWTKRTGVAAGGEYVFAGKGESTLRFRRDGDGGLAATWISPDGKTRMMARLRRIGPVRGLVRAAAR
jgi:pimeloyl-ACP methyl ester carboxylesterase